MTACFSPDVLKNGFHRLLSRLLRGETGPLMMAEFTCIPGMVQVPFRLPKPIFRTRWHGVFLSRGRCFFMPGSTASGQDKESDQPERSSS